MRVRATNITPELGIDNGKGRPVIRDTWPTALAAGESRVGLFIAVHRRRKRGGDNQTGRHSQAAPHLTHLRACRFLRVEVLDDDDAA